MHKHTEQYNTDPEFRAKQLAYKKKQAENWTPEQKVAKAAYLKEYRAKHKEERAQKDKEYREHMKAVGKVKEWNEAKQARAKEKYAKDEEFRKRRQEDHTRWQESHPENTRYSRKVRKDYGLTVEDVGKMKTEQDNKCAVCQESIELVVDHCHTTNMVRAMLCHSCNIGLGMFKDDPTRMVAAAHYIMAHHPERIALPPDVYVNPNPNKLFQPLSRRAATGVTNCLWCGNPLDGQQANAKYCKRSCKGMATQQRRRDRTKQGEAP